MIMKNLDIRSEIKLAGLKLWEIADELGITDSYFSKKLRYEMSQNEKDQIRNIVIRLKEAH